MVKPVIEFLVANEPRQRIFAEGLTTAQGVKGVMPRTGFVNSVVNFLTHMPANEGKALVNNPAERLF